MRKNLNITTYNLWIDSNKILNYLIGLPKPLSYMEKKLLEIINHILESSDKSKLNDLDTNLNLRTDLGMDSFQLAELTVRIEDEFNIDIFEKGIINTTGEILEILKNV